MAKTARNGAPDLDIESIDYDAIKDPGHGNTPAAWMGVFIMLIGAVVATVGNVIASNPVMYAGVAIFILGPIIGLVMRAAGKGKPRS